jgi:hypothetical protein
VGWIVAAFFVIGMVAIAAGIVAYSAHRLPSEGSPTPSVSPSSLAPSANGTQTPGPAPSTSPTSRPIPPPGGNLSASGVNATHTIACNDSNVAVSGTSNRVVISGHCTSLTVSGVQNSVTVDSADTIEANGVNNKVAYHTGSPSINKFGDSNVVQQG